MNANAVKPEPESKGVHVNHFTLNSGKRVVSITDKKSLRKFTTTLPKGIDAPRGFKKYKNVDVILANMLQAEQFQFIYNPAKPADITLRFDITFPDGKQLPRFELDIPEVYESLDIAQLDMSNPLSIHILKQNNSIEFLLRKIEQIERQFKEFEEEKLCAESRSWSPHEYPPNWSNI